MKKITLILSLLMLTNICIAETTTVFIHGVNVSKFPSTKSSGKSWDNRFEDYKPDMYILLKEEYHGKSITSNVYTNFKGGELLFVESMLILANDYDTITMTFLDEDSITSDDVMGTFIINHTHLTNGVKYYDSYGVFEKRVIQVNTEDFIFEITYHLKKDIGTRNSNTQSNNDDDRTEINEEQARMLINGNWKSSCGRSFTLVALGETVNDATIKQYVGNQEIVFKPFAYQNTMYFQTMDKTKKFHFVNTNTIQYETSDGFKCTWTKE